MAAREDHGYILNHLFHFLGEKIVAICPGFSYFSQGTREELEVPKGPGATVHTSSGVHHEPNPQLSTALSPSSQPPQIWWWKNHKQNQKQHGELDSSLMIRPYTDPFFNALDVTSSFTSTMAENTLEQKTGSEQR